MYLLDSNIVIRAFQGYKKEAEFLRDHIKDSSIVISVIMVAEFLVKATDEQRVLFDSLVRQFGSVAIDEEVARLAGEYRKSFLSKTKKVFLTDCFLAAQAKVHKLILVTNNKTDFPMKDIEIISP